MSCLKIKFSWNSTSKQMKLPPAWYTSLQISKELYNMMIKNFQNHFYLHQSLFTVLCRDKNKAPWLVFNRFVMIWFANQCTIMFMPRINFTKCSETYVVFYTDLVYSITLSCSLIESHFYIISKYMILIIMQPSFHTIYYLNGSDAFMLYVMEYVNGYNDHFSTVDF